MKKTVKRILAMMLVVVMTIGAAPLSGFVGLKLPDLSILFAQKAEAATSGYYTYTVSGGNATITDVNNSISGDITIPSSLGGYPVTSIGGYALCDCVSLTNVTIPDSVTSIGHYAFYRCHSLTRVIIPNSVIKIGSYAFSCCYTLTSAIIPASVTSIGYAPFLSCPITSITVDANNAYFSNDSYGVLYNKDKTKLIQFPMGNKKIGYEIPNSVTAIYNWAFEGCSSLTSIIIPYSVKSIGDNAFNGCDNLESVTIPSTVTNIGNWAFYGCSSLTKITVDSGNSTYLSDEYGVLFNKNKTVLIQYPIGNTNSNYVIPDGVTSIGDGAFGICTSLTSVTISNSVTSIGCSAFENCTSLISVTIGNSVTSIGYSAFENCTSLKRVTICNNVKSIDYDAFLCCDNLSDIYYTGTEAEWNAISIGSNNDPLINATIHYNYIPEGGEVTPPAEDDYSTQNIKVMSYNVYVKDGDVKGITNGKTYDCSYETRTRYIVQSINENMPDSIGLQELTSEMRTFLENFEDLNGGILAANYTGVGDYRSKSGNNNEASLIYYNKNKFTLKESGTFWLSESGDKYSTHSASDYPRICTYALLENKTTGLKYLHVNTHLEHDHSSEKGGSNDAAIFSSEKILDFINKKFSNTPVVITGDFNQKKGSAPYNIFIDAGYTDTRNVYSGNLNTYINSYNQGEDKKAYGVKVIDHILVNEYFKDGILSYKVYDEDYSNSSKYGNLALDYPYPSDHHPVVVELKATYSGDIILSKDIEFDDYDTVEVVFKDEWFEKSNSEYNHSLAQFCSDYVMMGYCYDKDEMKSYLSQMEFDTVDANMSTGRDEVNYFIASKDIVVNGEKETLVFAAFIGSYQKQWYSNFDPYGTKRDNWKNRNAPYADNNEKDKVHLGFADAREYVYARLKSFITKNNIDKENMKLLLSGHSRGAATANLLAAKLIDETYTNSSTATVNRNSIYTYTFATPNVASTQKNVFDSKYKCIFNIVNPEDFVTKVLPNSWGYYRYGKTYVLPSQTNDKNWKSYLKAMNKCFVQYKFGEIYDPYNDGEKTTYKIVEKFTKNINNLDEFYEKDIWAYNISGMIPKFMKPYDFFKDSLLGYLSEQNKAGGLNLAVAILLYGKTVYQDMIAYFFNPDLLLDASLNPGVDPGGKFKQAHQMETYCAYMNAMTESQIKQTRLYYENNVNCPVDIEVYDNATNELVGKITNNVIDETVAAKENAIVMDVEGDSKSFWLPSNGDYRVVLTGNDDGTMDYTVSNIDSDTGETERLNFFDVEIENGVSMEGEVNADEFVLDEYTLTHEEDGIIKPTEILVDEDLKDISISVTTEGIGYTDGNVTVTSGDYVTLNASTNEGNSFVGWYENGVLVSSDSAYSFVAKENRTLVAKFTNNRMVVWDVDGQTSVTYVKPGEAITVPENPVKEGYTFLGWTPSIPSVMPNEDMTFTAVFAFSATCPDCGQIFTDETAYNNHLVTHKKISVSVISGMVIGGELKLGATITIKAEQIDGKVFKQWVAEGAKVADKNSAETTAVIGAREITITAEYDDCECKCHKGGITAFFFKIVVFFQKLFGKNVECPCGAKH